MHLRVRRDDRQRQHRVWGTSTFSTSLVEGKVAKDMLIADTWMPYAKAQISRQVADTNSDGDG